MKRLLPLLLLCAGCVVDKQSYTVKPDGSYKVRISTTTFLVDASVAGMKSEWTADRSGMIYGDSVTNVSTSPSHETVEAITAGVVRGVLESGLIK